MPSAKKKRPKVFRILLAFILCMFILVTVILGHYVLRLRNEAKTQDYLTPFYDVSYPLESTKPGYILKLEELDISVPHLKTALRMVYVTQDYKGSTRVSSGMVFIPEGEAPVSGRPVLAWAHGTLGMGDACAPSRAFSPLSDMQWLGDALANGYVVAATDYAGLGTEGISYYLIGESEAHDVINSVRAAQNLIDAKASKEFVLFGHSQGGHSVLWSAKLAKSYAPELKLIAVAAAAPAAELSSLLHQEYKKGVSWGIGPEIAVSWPVVYADLDLKRTLSKSAYSSYRDLANECLAGNPLGIKARVIIEKPFFNVDPISHSAWKKALDSQNAPYLDPKMPLMIAQGLKDEIVLPNTTALYAKNACKRDSNLTMMWMGDVDHISAANTAGPYVISWLTQRLQGIPAERNCDQPLPIAPGV